MEIGDGNADTLLSQAAHAGQLAWKTMENLPPQPSPKKSRRADEIKWG
jgi:hypothetical protein